MNNKQNHTARAGQVERRVRLAWDVSRCTGENNNGVCVARNDCSRHLEFDEAGPFTLKYEAPIDAPLSSACELLIPKKIYEESDPS